MVFKALCLIFFGEDGIEECLYLIIDAFYESVFTFFNVVHLVSSVSLDDLDYCIKKYVVERDGVL